MNNKRPRAPLGERVLAGARDALAHAKGARSGVVLHPPAEVDVKAIRLRSGLSQAQFAARWGFPLDTVKNWETKRRQPEGPARTLLIVIDRHPEAVEDALSRRR